MILWLALACTAPAPEDEGSADSRVEDSAEADDSAITDDRAADDSAITDDSAEETGEPSGYRGQLVDPPRPPPDFLVLNSEHQERTPEWLAGAPTVLWFFRDASSST